MKEIKKYQPKPGTVCKLKWLDTGNSLLNKIYSGGFSSNDVGSLPHFGSSKTNIEMEMYLTKRTINFIRLMNDPDLEQMMTSEKVRDLVALDVSGYVDLKYGFKLKVGVHQMRYSSELRWGSELEDTIYLRTRMAVDNIMAVSSLLMHMVEDALVKNVDRDFSGMLCRSIGKIYPEVYKKCIEYSPGDLVAMDKGGHGLLIADAIKTSWGEIR